MKRHWGKVSLLGMVLFTSLVVLILSIGNSSVYAQSISNNSKEDTIWVNAGIGGSSSVMCSPVMYSLGVSFSYQTGKHLISIRFIRNEEFESSFGPLLGPNMPPMNMNEILYRNTHFLESRLFDLSRTDILETVWDIGILYGRSLETSHGLASLSGGISIVSRVKPEKEKSSLTMGFPIEVQLFWTPTSFFGIGIYGFANLNPEESFAGVLLCIRLGNLR